MSDVLCEVVNGVGYIRLNRPKALNSLNLEMVRGMQQSLLQWAKDDAVKAVVLLGEGEKGLCAGGDIRSVYENEVFQKADNVTFFAEEYELNQYIFEYPKPYIALMDGIVMGGGMGISQGAKFRIVTERSKVAMPESAIGFFPDVGGSYFLPRCPGSIGFYLGITGVTINAEDSLYSGLADYFLESSKLETFKSGLNQNSWSKDAASDIQSLLISLGARSEAIPSTIENIRVAIDKHFSLPTIAQILTSLDSEGSSEFKEWAHQTAQLMAKRSPISMVGTQALLNYGKKSSLAECFAMELGLVKVWLKEGDFVEGVRALIIDKDNQPKWRHSLEELTPEKIKPFFAHVKQ